MRGAGPKLPVNLVLVGEGEEEIGSPHFPQIVRRPEVLAVLRKCSGIYMPSAEQDLDGKVTMTLGAKGVIECELVSSGEKWGRGPRKEDRKSTRLNSSHDQISYAVFCLKKKKKNQTINIWTLI